MNKFQLCVAVIFLIKLIFIGLAVIEIYYKYKNPSKIDAINSLEFWKDRTEFIFIAFMSFMLLFLFNLNCNNLGFINKETKLLLFLFGIVLLITAKWDLFFKDSVYLTDLKDYMKLAVFIFGFIALIFIYS